MTISLNARLDEQTQLIQAASNAALTTTVGDCVYASFKAYRKATIIIDVLNATTVTGGTVTLKQATAVAGTGEKALAFTRMLANIDVAVSQAMTETAVSSNTFTTDTTNSKRLRYVIEVDAEQLDSANNFDAFRVDVTGMANAVGTVSYIMWGARYYGANALVD